MAGDNGNLDGSSSSPGKYSTSSTSSTSESGIINGSSIIRLMVVASGSLNLFAENYKFIIISIEVIFHHRKFWLGSVQLSFLKTSDFVL